MKGIRRPFSINHFRQLYWLTLQPTSSLQAFKICKSYVDAENAPFSLSLKCEKSNPPDGIEVSVDNQEIEWQTSMRLRLLSHYIQYLTLAVNEGDIVFSNFDTSSMNRIVDSILLGTPSERIEGKPLQSRRKPSLDNYISLSAINQTSIFLYLTQST